MQMAWERSGMDAVEELEGEGEWVGAVGGGSGGGRELGFYLDTPCRRVLGRPRGL